ncbi:MAG TPA: hypothetical protein VJ954_00710 [Ignavibacteriaceae bacterium]|nr:hypothetical protein [Ignavibacteriaceae bacterium]
MKQIPKHLYTLFWDVNTTTFDPLEYPHYTISRVLEFGNEEAVTWMKGLFSESEIKRVIKSDKKLSPKSANFWAIMFRIPIGEIAALKSSRRNIF